jgi:hypothetical protein
MGIDSNVDKILDLQEDLEREVREMNRHLEEIKDAVLALHEVAEKILAALEQE